jgi:hypothetical protein
MLRCTLNCVSFLFMGIEERESLSGYIRGLGIDNFSISDGSVRIGPHLWQALPCGCGAADCDGWSLDRHYEVSHQRGARLSAA